MKRNERFWCCCCCFVGGHVSGVGADGGGCGGVSGVAVAFISGVVFVSGGVVSSVIDGVGVVDNGGCGVFAVVVSGVDNHGACGVVSGVGTGCSVSGVGGGCGVVRGVDNDGGWGVGVLFVSGHDDSDGRCVGGGGVFASDGVISGVNDSCGCCVGVDVGKVGGVVCCAVIFIMFYKQ